MPLKPWQTYTLVAILGMTFGIAAVVISIGVVQPGLPGASRDGPV